MKAFNWLDYKNFELSYSQFQEVTQAIQSDVQLSYHGAMSRKQKIDFANQIWGFYGYEHGYHVAKATGVSVPLHIMHATFRTAIQKGGNPEHSSFTIFSHEEHTYYYFFQFHVVGEEVKGLPLKLQRLNGLDMIGRYELFRHLLKNKRTISSGFGWDAIYIVQRTHYPILFHSQSMDNNKHIINFVVKHMPKVDRRTLPSFGSNVYNWLNK
ncbi:MAG: hypothetical protein ACPGJS_01125 [Flammeovirgaceae bacterium]